MDLNARMPRIDTSRFSMLPRAEVPRSTFVTTHSLKTTFDFGYLVPIHLDEVLPGDVHQGQVTIFARLATPLFPIMDHMELETFFFFVPARLVWTNWRKMMGERTNPADSISYTVPQKVTAAGGYAVGSIYDYFGLPTVGVLQAGQTPSYNALPLRAYNLIYNEWFRDENLNSSLTVDLSDGPDITAYALMSRNKKHDYFTSALPWPIKGGTDISMPLSGSAPVKGLAVNAGLGPTVGGFTNALEKDGTSSTTYPAYFTANTANALIIRAGSTSSGSAPNIYADLSTATGATINALRLAIQTQRLLERDARSGTRYTELLRAHFGVVPEDQRLQRPEYVGGGRTSIQTSAIPQTSATGLTGGSSPLGALGATATATDGHSFSYHATEHGYLVGLANARAELTYQQGVHRLWTRSTRYDFYWPAFAHLGEQAIRMDEIYATGNMANDLLTFGYQERWAEYRHRPSRITGLFKSTSAGNIDEWHLAQQFSSSPSLNATFISENNASIIRALAAGSAANGMQLLFDSVFRIKTTRPMPMYSIPGNMDRF